MAFEINTPNMLLPQPAVGLTDGPQYASDINNCLTIIDQHNHTSGSGVQIPPAGLNINSDLPFNGNNATQLRSSRYTPQTSVLSLSTDLACTYVSGVDLYYNDLNGTAVRLTQNGSIVGTAGSISGLPSGTASVAYNGGTYVFQAATATAANIDVASVVLRNNTANSKGLTLQPPNAMGADSIITLPAIPATTSFATVDTSGNISASIPLANAFLPPGMVQDFAMASAPSGWLVCNGSAVSRTAYANLFAAIGTTWGVGDGTTTFNLPNFLGIFRRGAGTQTIGGVAYSGTLGTTQADQFQGHYHNTSQAMIGTNGARFNIGAGSDNFIPNVGNAVVDPTSDGTNGTPRTGAETRPANASVTTCIKI